MSVRQKSWVKEVDFFDWRVATAIGRHSRSCIDFLSVRRAVLGEKGAQVWLFEHVSIMHRHTFVWLNRMICVSMGKCPR